MEINGRKMSICGSCSKPLKYDDSKYCYHCNTGTDEMTPIEGVFYTLTELATRDAERDAYRDNYEDTIKQLKRVWVGCDTVGLAYIATDVVNNYEALQAQVGKLTEALRGWVDHAQSDRVLMAHSKLMDASHKALGKVEWVAALTGGDK